VAPNRHLLQSCRKLKVDVLMVGDGSLTAPDSLFTTDLLYTNC